MTSVPSRVPHRPGPIGRLVRLILGVLVLQASLSAGLAMADGVSGGPRWDNPGLWILVAVTAWVTPIVFDLGLGLRFGNGWRVGVALSGVVAVGIGAVVDAPGTALSYWLFGWITLTLGWLGLSFLVATALATPGCEMRALSHLRTKLGREQRDFAACPGPLQPLDEWEARTTGRARPHTPA